MKVDKKITFENFKAKVLFAMYKRGLTHKMMSQLFNISEHYFDEIITGLHRNETAKSVITDLIKYFM